MTLLDGEVKISGSLVRLESVNKLFFASVFASDTSVLFLLFLFPFGLFFLILLYPLS